MADLGHVQTDRLLESLEERLGDVYTQAYEDVKKKADDYFARFAVKDKAKRDLVAAGKLSKDEYYTWRRNQMLSGKRWTDLRDQLAQDLTNVNKIAAGMVRGELNEVFAINANYSEYMIENGMRMNYGFTLYDRDTVANLVMNDPDIIPWKPDVDVPADMRWNRQMVTSHITQGILQGESIPHLSKRLLKTVNNDKVAAVRTARTAVTSAQNAGRQAVYDKAKSMGLNLQKEWLATLDGRTRHDHGMADGQRVPLDGKFTVGGHKMKYPGDMSAPGWLVYNCRCTTVTVEPPHITKGEEPRKTYSEWAEEKKVQAQKAIEEQHKVTLPTKPTRPQRKDFGSDDAYQEAKKEYRLKKDAYNKQFDEIVKNTLNEKPAFQTKEEVVEWAKKNKLTVDDEVFETIDLRSFNEVKNTLEEMFERFPQIKSYEMEYFDGTTLKTTFNIGLEDTGLLSANGGFNFNKRFFADYEIGLRDALGSLSDGFFVRGDGSFSTLVRHEFGHNVQNYIESSISKKYHHSVDDWRIHYNTLEEWKAADNAYREERSVYENELIALAGLDGASEYSKSNTSELFAEGFAEYTSGGKTEFGVAFGGFLERWLKQCT